MKSLAVSVLLAALAAVVISEPLHLDLDVQVELSDHGTVQWHEEPRAEALSVKITTDDGDELPEVDIDYEVHRASPPCVSSSLTPLDHIAQYIADGLRLLELHKHSLR